MRDYTFEYLDAIPGFPFHLQTSVFPESFFEEHTHVFAELVIVRHGQAMHLWEGRRQPIRAGSVFVVGPGQAHCYEELHGLDLCNIGYDPARFLQSPGDLAQLPGFHALFHPGTPLRKEGHGTPALELDARGMHELYVLIEPIEEEYQARQPGCQAIIQAMFTLLVGYLSRAYFRHNTAATGTVAGLAKAVTRVQTHYAEPLRLDDLAHEAGMARTSFVRAFRESYGLSPMKYVMRFRLEKACELLMNERGMPVTEVGLATGFCDGNHFIRTFSKAFGQPPGNWRSRHPDPLRQG
jgi:AraC-like DNA-binding protein